MKLTWLANSIRVSDPSLWAGANHSSNRNCIQHTAPSTFQARFDNRTRINTSIWDTGHLGRTVCILHTFRLVDRDWWIFLAIRERVTQRSVLRTTTSCSVIVHVTDSISSAWILNAARINAVVVLAAETLIAVVVAVALYTFAEEFRVAEVTGGTSASRLVICAKALSVHCTLVLKETWVDALVVVASFRVGTVAAWFAFHWKFWTIKISDCYFLIV